MCDGVFSISCGRYPSASNCSSFPADVFLLSLSWATKGVFTWYRYDFHSGTRYIFVPRSIEMPMFVVPEWLCCFPDQHACATRSSQLGYSFHTGTNLVTAFTWYRYGLWSAFIPERNFRTGTRTGVNSYRYDSYRCGISYYVITNTEPQVGTGMDSYRNESHTGIM